MELPNNRMQADGMLPPLMLGVGMKFGNEMQRHRSVGSDVSGHPIFCAGMGQADEPGSRMGWGQKRTMTLAHPRAGNVWRAWVEPTCEDGAT